jgi:hypothetical protein
MCERLFPPSPLGVQNRFYVPCSEHLENRRTFFKAGRRRGGIERLAVTKRNLNRGSTLPNNAWDALQHRFDNNWSLFAAKPLWYRGTVTPRSLSLSVTASVTSHSPHAEVPLSRALCSHV